MSTGNRTPPKKSTHQWIRITLAGVIGALTASPANAWVATRLSNGDGTYSDIWGIKCNDGTVFRFAGADGPDFDYKGCANHGGLIVSSDPHHTLFQEFPLGLNDFSTINPDFPLLSVGNLVSQGLLSPDDATTLAGPNLGLAWSRAFVTMGPGFDPATDYPGVSIFGYSQDIAPASVPEAGSMGLLLIGFAALGLIKRRGRPGAV